MESNKKNQSIIGRIGKAIFGLVFTVIIFLGGMQSAQMSSIPETTVVNRFSELIPLYKAYELEQQTGVVEFDSYVKRITDYQKIYKNIELHGKRLKNRTIKIYGKSKSEGKCVIYDDSSTSDLDWFVGSKKSPPNENDLH